MRKSKIIYWILSPWHNVDFEKRMKSDSVLREEVVLQQKLMTAVELGSFKKDTKESKPPRSKTIKIYAKKVWLVAAVFVAAVLFSFIGYLFLRDTNSSGTDLYEAYFYEDPGLAVVMSSTDDYEFYDGMVSYKEGNYEEAITVWSNLSTSRVESDTLRYYQGVALMNLGKMEESATFLDLVVGDNESGFQAKASWYRALIHLRKDEIDLAIGLLENLLPEPRAEELLKELRKSP